MTAKTVAERKAAERQRRAEKGLKRVEEWIPPEGEEAIRRLAQRLRKEQDAGRSEEHP